MILTWREKSFLQQLGAMKGGRCRILPGKESIVAANYGRLIFEGLVKERPFELNNGLQITPAGRAALAGEAIEP